MPKNPKQQTFKLKNLFSKNIVVNFENGIVSPLFFRFIVMSDSVSDTGSRFLRDASDSDVEDLVFGLLPTRYGLVQNVESSCDVRNGFPIASLNIKAASFDES